MDGLSLIVLGKSVTALCDKHQRVDKVIWYIVNSSDDPRAKHIGKLRSISLFESTRSYRKPSVAFG